MITLVQKRENQFEPFERGQDFPYPKKNISELQNLPEGGYFGSNREFRPQPFERTPPELERRQDLFSTQEKMLFMERERMSRDHGLFEMRLMHHEGSLEIAINNNRLRNIWISFGILAILGASIVFLILSTTRARRLALQQLEFVAGISHELRTPLAVLKTAGENLADGVIKEKGHTRKYGELIKNEVVRLSEMVEKALTYAGIHSGKQNYELRPLDITLIVTEAIRNTKKLLPLNNFIVHTEINQDLPQVLGDATALQSAIENLIINGIKYSSEKNWIHIKVHQSKGLKENYLEINVEDRGIGITAADISKIFKPFYRGRNAIEGQVQGNGLGLSIAKYIIESHGGTISVKSFPGKGSVFTIFLPSIVQDEKNELRTKTNSVSGR